MEKFVELELHGAFKSQNFQQIQLIHLNHRNKTYKAYSSSLKEWICFRFPLTYHAKQLIRQQAILLLKSNHIPNLERIVPELLPDDLSCLPTYWLEGLPSSLLMRQKTISIEERMKWIVSLAKTLQSLHDAGIVHGDLQPENIIISREQPLLIDFELSFHLNQIPCYTFGGTGPYMSPEVRLGKRCERQSEQYTFAILAYEWITCNFCFGCPDLFRLPCEMRAPFQQALQIRPSHRFPSVLVFARALLSSWAECNLCRGDFFQNS
ncbi:protein kinase domain-containing protein [Candidatus Similichlamydia epinepheli]|uniref:protein kinase domain-containing protein n=1 Tax=Candidatus Similichlamydia epinepheli TaxID=1903953 RepID=UPI000D3BF952|nr:protein kinase [Candidatus Similichlamydia epinepheli]